MVDSKEIAAYRTTLRTIFRLIAADSVPQGPAEKAIRNEALGAVLVGKEAAAVILDEEAAAWRDAQKKCPFCGGEPQCST